MASQVTATVLGGMLKPGQALPLADHTRVKLTIEPIGEAGQSAQGWESLKARLRQRPIHASGLRYTRDDLHERR